MAISARDSIVMEKDKRVSEMTRRATGLLDEIDHRKSSLNVLREKYDALESQLLHEQSEKQKLANVLKYHMAAVMPVNYSGRDSGTPGGKMSRTVSLARIAEKAEEDGSTSPTSEVKTS